MATIDFEGFSTVGVSQSINLPELTDLLRLPMFHRVSADDLYRHGGEINRWLLDNTPLKNNRKYVSVSVDLKYLTPDIMPMMTLDWHCDGSPGVPFLSSDHFHILVGHSTCTTEFAKDPISWQLSQQEYEEVLQLDHFHFRRKLQTDVELGKILPITPVSINTNQFYSFNSRHVHRAPDAPKHGEFRFFWRVTETDFDQSRPLEEAKVQATRAYNRKQDKIMFNYEQGANGIILRNLL